MSPLSTLVRKTLSATLPAIIVTSFLGVPNFTQADSNPILTGGAAVSGITNVPTPITDIRITGTGNPVVPVRLSVSAGSLAMTTTTGLTFTGSLTGSTLQFSGTLSDDNAALATLSYTRSGTLGTDTLQATTIDAGMNYDSDNGHVYQVVSSVGDWPTAKAAADAMNYRGAGGYLVTTTSGAETGFVIGLLPSDAWMGASDATVEGEWRWVDGPENGTHFWNGGSSGNAVNGQFTYWNSSEPNNSGGNENCGEFQHGSGGVWNDFTCSGTMPAYVVEFGAPGQLPAVSTLSESITTNRPTKTIATCNDLQGINDSLDQLDEIILANDIDCTGVNYQVPFSAGTTFKGIFDGGYHTITGLTANHSADNYVGFMGKLQDATFKNVSFNGGSLTGNGYVGVIGTATGSITMQNVHSDLTVTGSQPYVGGLIGYFRGSSRFITNLLEYDSNTGNVTGSTTTGGLIGGILIDVSSTVTIQKVYTTGNVSSNDGNVGGLIGQLNVDPHNLSTVTIQDAYSSSIVNSTGQTAGGLIGSVSTMNTNRGGFPRLTIQRVYSSGAVTGSDYVGGLFGSASTSPSATSSFVLTNTFTTSPVTANDPSASFFGGVIGDYEPGALGITSTNNYFDQTQTLMSSEAGSNPLNGIAAVNTDGSDGSYFINNSANTPLNSWDFGSIWNSKVDSYPTLIAFVPPPPSPTPTPTPTPTPSQTPTSTPSSSPTSAPSPTVALDGDSDGINTAIEDAAPNAGDANNDGIKDSVQTNVTSFTNPVTGHYMSAELTPGCSITAAGVTASADKPTNDVAFSYPAGLLTYTASCGNPGFTTTVNLYYYGVDSGQLVARKYNAKNQSYGAVPGATISQITLSGQTVTKLVYQVTDGGPLDEDGSANGVIIDPVGLAVSIVGVPNTGLGGSQNLE